MAAAWVWGDHASRRDLLEILLAVLMALAIAQVVAHVWPQPRPFQLHLGTQYLQHNDDPGLPSDHVTVFWSLGFAALLSRQHAVWGFPLLATGLAVGWCRVYLGVHFPYDILAALPVALGSVALAHAARRPLFPVVDRIMYTHDRLVSVLRKRFRPSRRS